MIGPERELWKMLFVIGLYAVLLTIENAVRDARKRQRAYLERAW